MGSVWRPYAGDATLLFPIGAGTQGASIDGRKSGLWNFGRLLPRQRAMSGEQPIFLAFEMSLFGLRITRRPALPRFRAWFPVRWPTPPCVWPRRAGLQSPPRE